MSETVQFKTLGGALIKFVYLTPNVSGEWTCGGCQMSRISEVGRANDHAAQCRAVQG